MPHIEGTFPVAGNRELYYQAWLPDSRPRATIVLVHGLADHSGRYANVVNYLVPRGCAIWSYDQRGHGKSPGARCYFNRFNELTDDLGGFVDLVAERNPDHPLFIIGHSLGALESAAFVADHPRNIAGVALSGLLLRTGQSVPKLVLSLAGVLSALLPRMGIQHIECDTISRDPSVVEAYLKDPLVYTGKIPARTGAELIAAMTTTQANVARISMPVLLLHGAADRLADPSGSRLMYNAVASKDKEIHLFNGCYHEIFNEPCRDFVLGTLSRWLDKHLSD
jgi:alpha-beta hydrolase superfamily lysophospholipase